MLSVILIMVFVLFGCKSYAVCASTPTSSMEFGTSFMIVSLTVTAAQEKSYVDLC